MMFFQLFQAILPSLFRFQFFISLVIFCHQEISFFILAVLNLWNCQQSNKYDRNTCVA